MTRTIVLGAVLGTVLLVGCAATGDAPETADSELVQSVRQELALDPLLDTSRLRVTERDGTVVIGGFVESLEDLDAIRETIEGVDGVTNVENDVVVSPE